MQPAWDSDLLEYAYWGRTVRGLADTTLRVRLDVLQRLHVHVGIPLREVQPGQLLRFERVAIAGRAPQTRRAYVSHLRAFYAWLLQTGAITDDPTTLLTVPVMPRRLPRPIEEEALKQALAAAKPKMAAMLTLAAFAGLRCVEIAGLDWSDLVREADGAACLHVRHGKGAKQRRVEVGTVVIRALQRYGVKRRGAMFLGQDGAPIDARSVSSSGNRFLDRNGFPYTMHQLRHRYATVAYQLSRDLRMVQEMLGHESPQTTACYARPSAEAAARMVAQMDALALPDPRSPGTTVRAAAP